jgi:hypothetical protein
MTREPKRHCSKCGSNKTSVARAGTMCSRNQTSSEGRIYFHKSPSENWYRNAYRGLLCKKCYSAQRYNQRKTRYTKGGAMSRTTHRKIQLLRLHQSEVYDNIITRIVDYYIKNRLDRQTRKQLLHALKEEEK